jgi:hypothetical protein
LCFVQVFMGYAYYRKEKLSVSLCVFFHCAFTVTIELKLTYAGTDAWS